MTYIWNSKYNLSHYNVQYNWNTIYVILINIINNKFLIKKKYENNFEDLLFLIINLI